uniref:Uncharacterized protein n=1 Tax=Arundo donax TaxID=35708 RepID=A0A0A9E3M9_ARUDO
MSKLSRIVLCLQQAHIKKRERKRHPGRCTSGNHVVSWALPNESLPIGTQEGS